MDTLLCPMISSLASKPINIGIKEVLGDSLKVVNFYQIPPYEVKAILIIVSRNLFIHTDDHEWSPSEVHARLSVDMTSKCSLRTAILYHY